MWRGQFPWYLAVPLGAVLACTYNPRIPEGVLACTDTADCPSGYFCAVSAADPTGKVCCLSAECAAGGGGGADASRPSPEDGSAPSPDRPADDRPAPEPPDLGLLPEPDDAGPKVIDAHRPPHDGLAPPPPSDAAPDLNTSGCPAWTGGPVMVRAGSFCIDSTEVTNLQYDAFLTARSGDVSGQPGACRWNTSYRPSNDTVFWPYSERTKDHPVVNVDWCDAYMFCKWAGKRLCGKIGGGRLGNWMASAKPAESQWAAACTGGGRTAYPYPGSFNKETCNLKATSETASAIEAVKTHSQCEGGYPGLFDMSGNVMEWLDACDGDSGEEDLCSSAGTSAWMSTLSASDVTCSGSPYGAPREDAYYFRGFRCCSE